ncbi:MAG TPA: trehalose-phosphatase [Hyphomicrobium sp.]|jgi:trehalose 6-phosphate phosphatase|nr:trehalose-phosphatase [Hyphomicrobium sp.]
MQELKKDNALHCTGTSQLAHETSARRHVERLLLDRTPIGLFLDIDGTLLDVALTPSTVHVPPGLAELLGTLASRLSGALAIVTGRPIAEADELLKPMKFVAAGVHGAEMRMTTTGGIKLLSPSFNPTLLSEIRAVAIAMPGVVTEDKGTGIALHYRLAPELRDSLLITLEALIPKYPGQFTICEGRKVVEILPVGFSKGRALRKLASLPDFADRIPVMIGDDIADLDAFRAAEELGGYGLKVAGENFSEEEASFIGPADVLKWLGNIRTLADFRNK